MQYLARLPLSDDLDVVEQGNRAMLLFQCQQDPGMCDEWDSNSGGNAALIVESAGAREVKAPEGPTVLETSSRISFQTYVESTEANGAQDQYNDAYAAPESRVIGKAQGLPSWIQGDETPTCNCGTAMKFSMQLEERAAEGLNFGGGGIAYAFVCPICTDQAKLLWQC